MSRVVVVGGGVIGCAIAERLSLERHQVTLFERDRLAGRASGAAGGELNPQSTERIEKDGAMNVEYHVQQALQPAFTEEEAAALRASGGRWLDAGECLGTEPR